MNIQEFVVLALAVAAASFTIARTKITEPLRKKLGTTSWFGKLINCPYCVSHWLSFGAVGIYRVRLVDQLYVLDLLVTAMAMVAVSAFIIGQIQWALTR